MAVSEVRRALKTPRAPRVVRADPDFEEELDAIKKQVRSGCLPSSCAAACAAHACTAPVPCLGSQEEEAKIKADAEMAEKMNEEEYEENGAGVECGCCYCT